MPSPDEEMHPLQTADEVPVTPVTEEPITETAALSWLKSALTHQHFVQDQAPTRENSLAITNLQQAIMWAELDIKNKKRGN